MQLVSSKLAMLGLAKFCCQRLQKEIRVWFLRGLLPHPQAAKGVSIKGGLQASLSAMFDAAMFKAWPLAKSAGVTTSSVIKCPNYKNGDFQCNAAMALYKALKVSTKAC